MSPREAIETRDRNICQKTCLLHDLEREQLGDPPELSESRLPNARRLLFLSHFFNQFSENSWQFCLVLFLTAFSNYKSLILVSSYGLVSSSFVCYFGSAAGRFVDGTNRLVVARCLIGCENCAVLLATFCCYLLVMKPHSDDDHQQYEGIPIDFRTIFLLVLIHFLGATAKILDTGFLVAVERDWIVVMSKSVGSFVLDDDERSCQQKLWLSNTNVAMKQIDLSCKVVAPAVTGIFVSFFDDGTSPNGGINLVGAAIFIGMLNFGALCVEYVCTARIYHDITTLSFKRVSSTLSSKRKIPSSEQEEGTLFESKKSLRSFFHVPEGLAIYLEQDISYAGIGLSMLYLNVLTFGGIMTAYLVWKGMDLGSIGFWRGVSSAVGLLGTFVYHFMSTRTSLVNVGMSSITFQFFLLTLSFGSLFVDDFLKSLIMLIAGVCASRVGLWVFDISVTQLYQLHVDEDIRGLVGGVQQSLNAFFGMLSFALGILISDPKNFRYYASVGYGSVGLGFMCYFFGVYQRREHIADDNSLRA